MRPAIALDGAQMRANVRAFEALGAPVAAVVKGDGYGWGVARVVREIDALIESYVVSDADEFWALRACTRKAIRLLTEAPPPDVPAIVAAGGIVCVASAAAVAAVPRGSRVRIGIVDAAGWDGIAARDAAALGAMCAERDLACEVWTHLTSSQRVAEQEAAFDGALAAVRASGARMVSVDVSSTGSAAPQRSRDRLRVGAGLFGARLGSAVAIGCAIRVSAPLVRSHAAGAVRFAGYGDVPAPVERPLSVYRFGYADGAPKGLVNTNEILSIGMQYLTRSEPPEADFLAIGPNTDLDMLAQRSGVSAHEVIVRLGRSA